MRHYMSCVAAHARSQTAAKLHGTAVVIAQC